VNRTKVQNNSPEELLMVITGFLNISRILITAYYTWHYLVIYFACRLLRQCFGTTTRPWLKSGILVVVMFTYMIVNLSINIYLNICSNRLKEQFCNLSLYMLHTYTFCAVSL
jgi:hypothetical protein